jgi:hypothetical protein
LDWMSRPSVPHTVYLPCIAWGARRAVKRSPAARAWLGNQPGPSQQPARTARSKRHRPLSHRAHVLTAPKSSNVKYIAPPADSSNVLSTASAKTCTCRSPHIRRAVPRVSFIHTTHSFFLFLARNVHARRKGAKHVILHTTFAPPSGLRRTQYLSVAFNRHAQGRRTMHSIVQDCYSDWRKR